MTAKVSTNKARFRIARTFALCACCHGTDYSGKDLITDGKVSYVPASNLTSVYMPFMPVIARCPLGDPNFYTIIRHCINSSAKSRYCGTQVLFFSEFDTCELFRKMLLYEHTGDIDDEKFDELFDNSLYNFALHSSTIS